MILTIYYDSTRNVMGDLYKNVINKFADKENMIVVIPSAYEASEFSGCFHTILKENVSCENNRFIRLIKMLIFIIRLTQYIKKYNISKVYFQIDQFLYDYTLLLLNRNIKSIAWIHDVNIHDGEGWIANIKKKLMKRILYPKFSRIIVSYKKAKDDLICSCGNAYDEKIEVIYLPRLEELEYPNILEDKDEIEYDYIFYGRIEKYKGLDLLLKAMDDITMKDVKLLIVGRGREDRYVKNNANKMTNVKFINKYVPNMELARLIKKSKYVILPYRNATGTQVIQVANYYKKAVLATKVGCFEEYVEEGVNGFFISKLDYLNIRRMMLYLKDKVVDKTKVRSRLRLFDLNKISAKLQDVIIDDN